LLETKDSSLFVRDDATGRNLYSYNLSLSFRNGKGPQPDLSDRQLFQKTLQQDLADVFPYNVSIEIIKRPVYELIAIENNKLQKLETKGGSPYRFYPPDGITLKNISIDEFSFMLLSHVAEGELFKKRVVVNKTHITGNIDIRLDANMTDFDDILRELHKNGLDLIEEEKDLKVLVIKDKIGL